jgi:hypothetical protein
MPCWLLRQPKPQEGKQILGNVGVIVLKQADWSNVPDAMTFSLNMLPSCS